MASSTILYTITDSNWLQVSSGKSNVTVTNRSNQRIYVAVASTQSDLTGLTESHYIENKCSISFWNMATTGQNVFLYAPNGTASAIVTATDGLVSSSGSGTSTTGLTDTQLRASAVPVIGPLTDTQLRASALSVTGSFFQTTQPTSGDWLTNTQLRATSINVTGPLTDTQLRASAVPVSGVFWQTTQPISGTVTATGGDWLTNTQLRASALAVTGTFFQSVQPVSGTVSLGTTLPATLGRAAATASLATVLSNEDFAAIGSLTEAVPSTDTASSGLNGRLQKLAQKLTSLTALFPTTLGRLSAAASMSNALSNEDFAALGALTETIPASDTGSSGLNGRLQRIAQRLTSFIALFPTSIGQKTSSGSLSVVLASDQAIISTAPGPTSSASAAIVPIATTIASSSLVLKASAGNLYSLNVTTGANAGYVMVHNAVAAPANGAVTPIKVMTLPASSSLLITFDIPIRCSTGITVTFSTTGPFVQLLDATAFISGEAV